MRAHRACRRARDGQEWGAPEAKSRQGIRGFFPRFHLVFSPGADPSAIHEAGAALDLLGVAWIGIMRVSADGRLETVRRPKGSPVPDRSPRYGALVSALAVGRTSGP